MWPALLLILCGALPLFDAKPDNPWDAVRDVFYVRHFSNGQVYESDDSLTDPPWSNWKPFYQEDRLYGRVTKRLTQLNDLPKAALEDQSPLRRAILLRDLWPVFDRLSELIRSDELLSAQHPGEVDQQAASRQSKLCSQLASVMRRLELTEAEVATLPDNYEAALSKKLFPTDFDERNPETPFLPAGIFDRAGPWVAISRGPKTIGAEGHSQSVQARSIFRDLSERRPQSAGYAEFHRNA
jgi:hypothetical protein